MSTPKGINLIYTMGEPRHSFYIVDGSGVTLRQDGLPGEAKATWLVTTLEDQLDQGHIYHTQTGKQLTLLLDTEGGERKPRDVVIRGELTGEEERKRQIWVFAQDAGGWTIKSLFDDAYTIVTRKEEPFPENQNITITSNVNDDLHHSKWTFAETKS